ncbi:hypothetical protein I546_5624 [Mycobacterium kansasii 732]|nr:hypothetical protein I546_5624 [Mycobacterium kansasii 732]
MRLLDGNTRCGRQAPTLPNFISPLSKTTMTTQGQQNSS